MIIKVQVVLAIMITVELLVLGVCATSMYSGSKMLQMYIFQNTFFCYFSVTKVSSSKKLILFFFGSFKLL